MRFSRYRVKELVICESLYLSSGTLDTKRSSKVVFRDAMSFFLLSMTFSLASSSFYSYRLYFLLVQFLSYSSNWLIFWPRNLF